MPICGWRPTLRRKLFNNEKEYLKWARQVEVESDGLARGGLNEEVTYELLNNKPQRYPCITIYSLNAFFDRSGDCLNIFFDHIYLAEFTEGFNPRQAEDDWEARGKKADKYFIALQKLCDMEDANTPYEDCEKQYHIVRKLRTQETCDYLTEYFGFEVKPINKEYKRRNNNGRMAN